MTFSKTLVGWIAAASTLFSAPLPASLNAPPPLYTQAAPFEDRHKTVSTVVFVWFAPNDGQQEGPWQPLDGRANWTGETPWWKSQLKQMMCANLDLLYVHLTESWTPQRIAFFRAMAQLRAEGYDVPRVAPFLDAAIIYWLKPKVDVGTETGKDNVVGHYIRWYEQYFSVNTDPYADSYLARMHERPILASWTMVDTMTNLGQFKREDVAARLEAALSRHSPLFGHSIYFVSLNENNVGFVDERLILFQTAYHFATITYKGLTTAQLKGGYWDENIRTPGKYAPRDGGRHYRRYWSELRRDEIDRVYIESWNEYDEGTGIYAATGEPYEVKSPPRRDRWSDRGDPFEYIKTTAEGARRLNEVPDWDARILWHDFPAAMDPGEARPVRVIVRNQGDLSWTGAAGVHLARRDEGPASFTDAWNWPIVDTTDEIPLYGGIFRGRPVTFALLLRAPDAPGCYLLRFGMRDGAGNDFGEELAARVSVGEACEDCPTCPPEPSATPTWTAVAPYRTRTPTTTPTATVTHTPRPRSPTPTPTLPPNDVLSSW